METDEVEACSLTSQLSASFNVPESSQSLRSQSCRDLRRCCSTFKEQDQSQAQKIRKRRKPVRIVPKPQENLPSTSSNDPNSPVATFSKRKITTIHEGMVFHFDRHFPSEREMRIHNYEPHPHRAALSKGKAYKEKDAALKAIVSRLKKMANNKPEMLQDTLPDETIKLFKSIQIK